MTAAYRLARRACTSRSTSARRTSAGSSGRSTSTATRSIASTTSSCRATTACCGLAEELGLGDKFRFRPTKVGFYDDGRLFSMTSPKEFLTFPAPAATSGSASRAFVARCQLIKTTTSSTRSRSSSGCGASAAGGLSSGSGSRCSTRSSTGATTTCRRPTSGRERAGCPRRATVGAGGDGLARGRLPDADRRARASASSSSAARSTPASAVDQIVGTRPARRARSSTGASARSTSSSARSRLRMAPPAALAGAAAAQRTRRPLPLSRRRLPAAALARSISPYYHLNITDRRVPLTTIVETTHVVDPDAGRRPPALRLEVRRPRASRCTSGRRRDRARLPRHARTIFPDLRDEEILALGRPAGAGHRAGAPPRRRGATCPTCSRCRRLALASTAHVYPEIVSGQAVTGVAERGPGSGRSLERLARHERPREAA